VGIDRAEDGDAAAGEPTLPERHDPEPLHDPVERVAEHARYRASVENYGAAKDGWAQALPSLHAAWERHVEKYPERERTTPRTQPDGSWVDDGGRELSPEQNAEASKACEDIRAEGEEVILPAMQRVEATDPERHLAGLKNMIKSEDRVKEKITDELIAKPWLTVRQAQDTVADAVRFTLRYEPDRYADGVRTDVERLKAEGFELIQLKNLWAGDQYKGVNSQWCRPETGSRFEVQFHTPESLEAKELTHKAYERIRSGESSPTERRELEEFQRQANALILTPPRADEIKDFRKGRDEQEDHLLRDNRRTYEP
jgi:hypothetical protein